MPTPLRAFLIVRTSDGEPQVAVFHALEDLVRAWEARDDETVSAVLHIGFDRRPARVYSAALDEFRGRLLLTEAARAALPSSFRCSTGPIAYEGDAPIYLALEGWGYSAPDPAPKRAVPAAAPFADWVAAYVARHPEASEALVAAEVCDESSYLLSEKLLEHDLRTALGLHRFAHLNPEQADDPTAFVAAAPPWLLERDLTDLPLTVRLANVFRNRGLVKVGHLAELTLAEMMRLPNFGRTSSRHLLDILSAALAAGPPARPEAMAEICGTTLLASIELTLASCEPREAEILRRRMGFARAPETLAEIGEQFGVTRERIRQIEERAIKRLVRDEIWDDILGAKLERLLTNRAFPIPLLGIEALDPWFDGVASQRHAVSYALENMCASGVSLVEVDGAEYLSFLSQTEWDGFVAEARRLLSSGAGEHWSRSRCEYVVRSVIEHRGSEFRTLLWDVASRGCHFGGDPDDPELIGYGRGAEQVVEAILHDAEQPLHYSEIAQLASARAGREIDERRAHSAAAEVGHLFGPGTYGLMKHVRLSLEDLDAIADEASEVVFEGPAQRQWHTAEMLEALRQRGAPGTAAGKHVLDIALKRQGQLTSLGRMMWVAPGGDIDALRVEVRQAQIAILQQAGRPLTTGELRQRLIAVRGLNESMQLSQADPVIKLESSLWGLNDRDIPIKREHQPQLLDSVQGMLNRLGRSVHVSECSKLLSARISERTLISLIQSDRRFKTDSRRNIDLR